MKFRMATSTDLLCNLIATLAFSLTTASSKVAKPGCSEGQLLTEPCFDRRQTPVTTWSSHFSASTGGANHPNGQQLRYIMSAMTSTASSERGTSAWTLAFGEVRLGFSSSADGVGSGDGGGGADLRSLLNRPMLTRTSASNCQAEHRGVQLAWQSIYPHQPHPPQHSSAKFQPILQPPIGSSRLRYLDPDQTG